MQVLFWDLGQQQGARIAAGVGTPPGPDGVYKPLIAGAAAVNALAQLDGCLVTGHEDGALRMFFGSP